jgi:hypothetical protein
MSPKTPSRYPLFCRTPEERRQRVAELILEAIKGTPIEVSSKAECFSLRHAFERMKSDHEVLRNATMLIKRLSDSRSWVFLLPEPRS